MTDAIVSFVVDELKSMANKQITDKIYLRTNIDQELQNLSVELENNIRNILNDADNRRFGDRDINKWLLKLEATCFELDDILDKWNFAILKFKIEDEKKVWISKSIPIRIYKTCMNKIKKGSQKLQNVKDQLDHILKEKSEFNFVENSTARINPLPQLRKVQTTSLIDLDQVLGRDSDKDNLVTKIISNEANSLFILSIVGLVGLGKTTLAKLVYNDDRVKDCFDLKVWICVSGPIDGFEISKEIIRKGNTNTKQLDALLNEVKKYILRKKFLLVLDDVWEQDYRKWEPLRNSLIQGGAAGSTVIVTTRNENVAKMMETMDDDIYHPKHLSNEDCYMLLCRTIDSYGRKSDDVESIVRKSGDFESIGRKVANKCKGLPLAAKNLGVLLGPKNKLDEWENILKNEIWKFEKTSIFPHLFFSYNELSSQQKRCFSYCAVFPKDSRIDVRNLIDYWRVLGYLGSSFRDQDLELKGRECFNILSMHSLFQDFSEDHKSCKMHDIVHDFAQFVRKNGIVEKESMQELKNCTSCISSLVSQVKEYRSLFWKKKTHPHLCDNLQSLRVLKIMCNSNWKTIPEGMEKMIHLKWLDLSNNDLSTADLRTVFQLYNLQVVKFSKCCLLDIPTEIGNLTRLRDLDLLENKNLMELPESICHLLELQILNVQFCMGLLNFPEGIHNLTNLKYLYNWDTSLCKYPNGLAQLTGLCEMAQFCGGSGWNKLRLLNNLNNLGGKFELNIKLSNEELEGVVEDARDAELRKKTHIEDLMIIFEDKIDAKEESAKGMKAIRLEVINALEPHPNLKKLTIEGFKGFELEVGWLQTLNRLECIVLKGMDHVYSLPPLWKLSCLEVIEIRNMNGLKFVGLEFLGITTGGDHMNIESSAAAAAVAFPKLKKLLFFECYQWKEWQDIKEEEDVAISLMPCLTELHVESCPSLTLLPHHLLHHAPSLKKLVICELDKPSTTFNG